MTLSEKILRWIVLVGVFALPFICLIVATSLFFPFITGKNFMFRIIVEAITFAWLALALINPVYRPRRNWIFGAFLVFIVIMAIADAQGVNPFKSFWSNFERMDGWITIAHLFLYTVVAASVINAEKLWRRLFEISIGVSIFVDLLGFLQILGVAALGEGGISGLGARIDATFGNPIYLAVYMLFHIFLATLLIYQSGKEQWQTWQRAVLPAALVVGLLWSVSQGTSASAIAIILYLVGVVVVGALMFTRRANVLMLVIVLNTIALLFTGTRGTTFGLVGGTVLGGLIYMFLAPQAKAARKYILAGIAILIVAAGGLWLARDTAAVRSVGFLDRLVAISPTETTVAARFMNVGIAWQGIKQRPILGWGQEEYAVVFDKYYDPRMYPDEQWFDRVHDIVFDWWVAGGTLGILSYLGLLGAYLWVLWRSKGFDLAEKSILTGLLAGYFIHNLTVFDNITSYILFGTVLAYIAWRSNDADQTKPLLYPSISSAAAPVALCGAILLALGTVWLVNANAYFQNKAILAGLAQEPGGLSENLADFQQALSYGAFGEQEAREQVVQVATELAGAQGVSTSTQAQFFTLAGEQMLQQEKEAPLDARFPLFLGTMLDSYGDYTDAQQQLQIAHELSPSKQTILFELGLNAEARGDTAGALNYFSQAYNLEPDYLQARIYYATAAIGAGDDSIADQLLAPIIASGQAADPRIASAYGARNEFSKIITIWQAALKADPTNTQNYFTLAAAYYAAGNTQQAIVELKAAEAADPSATTKAEQAIQSIQSGTAKVQ
ncbi:MAG: tetratricopeptide repeat protein [Candidatus Pacebacteria bacterium]|nr:tetratricopeptide repeat protein [Candidatus Paceibacterota bacterium]